MVLGTVMRAGLHWLPIIALTMSSAVAQRLAAQPITPAATDSATRTIVVAGIIRALHEELARTVRDSPARPWVLFANDSTGRWAAERRRLEQMLHARRPRPEDEQITALLVPAVTIEPDSVHARIEVVYYGRCAAGWTTRGTTFTWAAPRRASWHAEGPIAETLWDGPSCAEIARHPDAAVMPPIADHVDGSRPPER